MSSMNKDALSNALDGLFLKLLELSEPSTNLAQDQSEDAPPPIGFLDRLRLFSEGVRWAAVKAKVETEDATDQFGELRRGLVGRTRASRSAGPATPRAPNGGA